jgi:hypothetical protein
MNRRRSSQGKAGYFEDDKAGSWLVCLISFVRHHPEGSQILVALSPTTGEAALIPVDKSQAPAVMSAFMSLLLR